MLVLIGIGFVAGLITAISPCVLPVLPILFAGGASGSRARPYAIIAGLVLSFTVFTLVGAALLDLLGLPQDFLRNAAIAMLLLLAATLLVPNSGTSSSGRSSSSPATGRARTPTDSSSALALGSSSSPAPGPSSRP